MECGIRGVGTRIACRGLNIQNRAWGCIALEPSSPTTLRLQLLLVGLRDENKGLRG